MDGRQEPFSPEIEEQLELLTSGVDMGDPQLLASMRRELGERLREGRPLRVYLGLDPTSPNVHLGHAVQLNKLAQFQDLGHCVTFLVGDFTARIGDPSGRSKTRPPLSTEDIQEHARTYTDQAFKALDRDRTEIRYNSEWLAGLTLEDVIRSASCLTLAQVLVRDDFKGRFEAGTPIHLHEFLYALAQGLDAVHLETDVQIGGTDQLFNLMTGRDIMRHAGCRPQVCLTLPLLPGTDGKLKMSKSYGNDIGLTTDPADMYGKVMSIPDEAMPEFFRLASGLPPDVAEARLAELEAGSLHPRDAKMELARTIVGRWHSAPDAARAEEAFVRQFRDHGVPEDVPELAVPAGKCLVLDLVASSGVAGSRSEARRLVQGGGISLDGEKLGDWKAEVGDLDGKVLRVGKRHLFRLREEAPPSSGDGI